jgi:hypothetical protein
MPSVSALRSIGAPHVHVTHTRAGETYVHALAARRPLEDATIDVEATPRPGPASASLTIRQGGPIRRVARCARRVGCSSLQP